ncbi:MAG: branched-chain amino acid ABC transporter permease [Acidimicrobiia bacterium]|nr:branched-chain amino acid ABC transporter permease [Acidimicrobiia bacterium]
MTTFLQATIAGLSLASIYALLALGFVIIYKAMQVVSFAHPAVMLFGAYMVSWFAVDLGVPFVLAVVLGALATALLGYLSERIAIRPMIGKPLFSIAIVTIGLDVVIRTPINNLIGLDIRGVGSPWGFNSWTVGGANLPHRSVAMIVTALVITLLLFLFFRYTRVGLAMRATAMDQEVALAQGINVGRIFALAWMMAGAMAAVAGMFAASDLAGLSASTYIVGIKALPAIVVGGLDSINGAVVGALVVGLAEAYTATYQSSAAPWLGSNFSQVVPYVVLLAVLLIRPYGLFGSAEVERV